MTQNKLWTYDFTVITIGSFISMVGSTLASFSISLVVLDYTGSTFLYMLFHVCYQLPMVVMPLLAGPYLDRMSRKKMIYTLDYASAGIFAAMEEVGRTGNLPIPTHLQDAHYKGAAKLGRGTGYKYAHDYPNNYVKQQYLPYELDGKEFYKPSGNGYEAKIREHMRRIKEEA